MILAIDTATDQGSVALTTDGQVLAELSWRVNNNHSRHLSRVINQLLDLEECEPTDVDYVVVASGPGSFSGIRIGISMAKGIAMALDVPLVGIGTLELIGFQACHISDRVRAFMPAGRGEVFTAKYVGNPETFERVGDHQVMTIRDAARRVEVGEAIAGPAASTIIKELDPEGGAYRIEPATMRIRRAAFLAELGRRYFDAHGADQTDALEPIYLRRSAAEEKLADNPG